MRGFLRDLAGILLSHFSWIIKAFGAVVVGILTGFGWLTFGVLGIPAVLFGVFGLIIFPISVLDLLFGICGGELGVGMLIKSVVFLAFSITFFLVTGSTPQLVKDICAAAKNNFGGR